MPGLKEKTKNKNQFEIWAEGCGAIWQHQQNYPNTSKASRVLFSFRSVTICELNTWNAPFKLIQTNTLSFGVFPWNKNQGTVERSYSVWTQYCKGCRIILEGKAFFEEGRCVIKGSLSSTRGKPAFGIELFWEMFREN